MYASFFFFAQEYVVCRATTVNTEASDVKEVTFLDMMKININDQDRFCSLKYYITAIKNPICNCICHDAFNRNPPKKFKINVRRMLREYYEKYKSRPTARQDTLPFSNQKS